MGTFLYVGNLAPSTTESTLGVLFATGGRAVKSVVILRSARNGRSRGFGFVELDSEEEIETTISAVNGAELDGRVLVVSHHVQRQTPGQNRDFQFGFGRPYGARRKR